MDDSKVIMFPDGYSKGSIDPALLMALQNGGGFGNNGWIWLLFMWMMWGNNNGFGGMNGGTGFLANQANQEAGTNLILQALNGRADALGQLAQLSHSSIDSVRNTLGQLQLGVSQATAQVGMSGLETINALQLGNANLSRQICECCCENRLAIANQTNAIQSQSAANHAAMQLQLAQNEAADQLSVCQQTNQLGSQADRNLNTTLGAIANLQTNITKEFCDIREREMQSKINTQSDIITQLRGQLDNDRQTAQLYAAISPIQAKVNEIANKQPNTVPVEWPNLQAVNVSPYINGAFFGGFGNGNNWNGSFWG